ncbi:hypothetical protein RFI_25120, partial [Reticulomyxa filosa]
KEKKWKNRKELSEITDAEDKEHNYDEEGREKCSGVKDGRQQRMKEKTKLLHVHQARILALVLLQNSISNIGPELIKDEHGVAFVIEKKIIMATVTIIVMMMIIIMIMVIIMITINDNNDNKSCSNENKDDGKGSKAEDHCQSREIINRISSRPARKGHRRRRRKKEQNQNSIPLPTPKSDPEPDEPHQFVFNFRFSPPPFFFYQLKNVKQTKQNKTKEMICP